MAQRVEIILIDDMDESPADEKVKFALDGTNYEIDLSATNAAALRELLAPYVGAGRPVAGPVRELRACRSGGAEGGKGGADLLA